MLFHRDRSKVRMILFSRKMSIDEFLRIIHKFENRKKHRINRFFTLYAHMMLTFFLERDASTYPEHLAIRTRDDVDFSAIFGTPENRGYLIDHHK